MKKEDIKYKLYSPSLEDKPFFDWPLMELDLSDKSKNKLKSDRPVIVRPRINISEKVIVDRLLKLNVKHVLTFYNNNYNVPEEKIREYRAGGKYQEEFHKGFELTKKIIIKFLQQVFEEYRKREIARKEKELKEGKPEVVVAKASELLHSK